MFTNRARLLALAFVIIAVGACSATDVVSPVSTLRPAPATHIEDSIPNSGCRSGYSGVNGRCTGE
jgi:hypothetical protein